MIRSLLKTALMISILLPYSVFAAEEPASDEAVVTANPADAILGIWATDKAEAHVEISKAEDDTYSATIIWLEEPFYPEDDEGGMAGEPKVDRENPDPELRDRPIEGLRIMQGLVYEGDGEWEDGEIYDPETGNTYSSEIWLTDEGTLKVRGYVGFSLFGRTTEWTPVLLQGAPGAGGNQGEESPEDAATPENAADGDGEA